MGRVADLLQLCSNMGWRYVSYRILYEVRRKTGLLRRRFPVNPPQVAFIDLAEWRKTARPFFFRDRDGVEVKKNPSAALKESFDRIIRGEIPFFNHSYFELGPDYDWLTNPDTGFRYDVSRHWTGVNDYSREAGDIKYVWEKSRFSYLYTVIRYDYHFGEDHSEFVFGEIERWMDANPVNMGPNYKCSQEISLRLLNWIFALYFYRDSPRLTDDLFGRIVHFVYWQLHHVRRNINFSRLTVRNNHAITETLALYVVSMLFPWFPESDRWKRAGKKWFTEEIEYQIYDDGTFLQFSMNYHRVVVQLLTWAIRIADANGDRFSDEVYGKAYKSVNFLYQCQEDSNGRLPNYGANDGALFFKLSENDYRDYRPQLDALHRLLTGKGLYGQDFEDAGWYGSNGGGHGFAPLEKKYGVIAFEAGGYYLIRDSESLTFIRCGGYKDRPSQADNLHIDIWYRDQNILVDGGSYKYNTDEDTLRYFMGTRSHNTVMLGDHDQMRKGARFIWYDWTQRLSAEIQEEGEDYLFRGVISCYRYLDKNITHERIVRKIKDKPRWVVTDIIHRKPPGLPLRQIWHSADEWVVLSSKDEKIIEVGAHSPYYGYKEPVKEYIFVSGEERIETEIEMR